jgi:aspartate kinase
MTTDPRKVATARTIPAITYAEAAELAFFGAKVVHPATIQPAVEKQIPVLVKNTKNPSHPGTVIWKEAPGQGLRAIAGRKGATLITVSSSRMLNAYGFLRRIFEIFDRHRFSVDLVATSEVSVSMTLEDKRDLSALVADLETLGSVKVEPEVAILCLVGQELWKDNRLVARVFEAIPDLPVRMISLGSSEINLSVVLKAKDLDPAVAAIHKAFFGT